MGQLDRGPALALGAWAVIALALAGSGIVAAERMVIVPISIASITALAVLAYLRIDRVRSFRFGRVRAEAVPLRGFAPDPVGERLEVLLVARDERRGVGELAPELEDQRRAVAEPIEDRGARRRIVHEDEHRRDVEIAPHGVERAR